LFGILPSSGIGQASAFSVAERPCSALALGSMPLFVLQRASSLRTCHVAGLALAMAGLAATPGRPKACAGGAICWWWRRL